MSTRMSKQHLRSNYMGTVVVDDASSHLVVPEERIDIFDTRLLSLLRSITRTRPVVYRGDQPLTTLVNTEYGNTSVYWIVLAYNGFVHPMEIRPGAVIELPSASEIDRFRSRLNTTDRRGQKVTI